MTPAKTDGGLRGQCKPRSLLRHRETAAFLQTDAQLRKQEQSPISANQLNQFHHLHHRRLSHPQLAQTLETSNLVLKTLVPSPQTTPPPKQRLETVSGNPRNDTTVPRTPCPAFPSLRRRVFRHPTDLIRLPECCGQPAVPKARHS